MGGGEWNCLVVQLQIQVIFCTFARFIVSLVEKTFIRV